MTSRLPTNRLTRHLLFWVVAMLLVIMDDISNAGSFSHPVKDLAGLLLVRLPTCVTYTYLLAYWIVPLLFRRQFIGLFAGILLLNLAEWLLNDLMMYSLKFPPAHWLYGVFVKQDDWLFSSIFPGTPFWPNNVVAGVFICVKLFRQWQQKLAESQRLEREKLSQELALLKLQINPDLLFGSLTTLHKQIRQQSPQAPVTVLHLAHYLRYVLYESQANAVPLAHEVDSLTQYILLQRTLRPDLLISFNWRGHIDDQQITPVILVTLVEQALVLTAPPSFSERAWASVDLAIDTTGLTLKVIYSHADGPAALPPALTSVRQQLAASYGDTGLLQTIVQPETCLIVLQLPPRGPLPFTKSIE